MTRSLARLGDSGYSDNAMSQLPLADQAASHAQGPSEDQLAASAA